MKHNDWLIQCLCKDVSEVSFRVVHTSLSAFYVNNCEVDVLYLILVRSPGAKRVLGATHGATICPHDQQGIKSPGSDSRSGFLILMCLLYTCSWSEKENTVIILDVMFVYFGQSKRINWKKNVILKLQEISVRQQDKWLLLQKLIIFLYIGNIS